MPALHRPYIKLLATALLVCAALLTAIPTQMAQGQTAETSTMLSMISSFSFEFPKSWGNINEGKGRYFLGNINRDRIDKALKARKWNSPSKGEVNVSILEPVVSREFFKKYPDMSPMDAFNIFKDPTPTEELVGKHKAARFDITGIPGTPENLDVVLWTVQVEGLIAYAQVSTARGEMADFEPTVKTILSSLRFESISPTADGPASLGGKILFVSQRDGNLELYSMNADGSQQKRLTNTKQNEQCADWSPDGSQIVYSRTDDFQIYTMAADGSRQKKISSGNNITSNPSYSPDGKRIAYASLQRSGNTVKQANIRLVNANGSNGKDLIPKSDFLFVSDPEWTADGTTILFVASKQASGKAFLYTINVDGTGLKQLFSQSVSTKASPRWSPDGSQILFHVEQDNGNLAVYVVNADGTNSRRVTPGHYNNRNTVWAPDGKHLLVMSNRDGFFKLYLIDLDGKFVSQLTHSIYDGCPAWWFDNTQEAAK